MTYLAAVDEFSDGAVAEACRRYTFGNDGRDADERRFPPSVRLFREMVQSVETQIRLASAPPKAIPVEIKRSASWHKMREKVQAAIAEYRSTYAEALKSNPKIIYLDHILAEHRRATGRELKVAKPVNHD